MDELDYFEELDYIEEIPVLTDIKGYKYFTDSDFDDIVKDVGFKLKDLVMMIAKHDSKPSRIIIMNPLYITNMITSTNPESYWLFNQEYPIEDGDIFEYLVKLKFVCDVKNIRFVN